MTECVIMFVDFDYKPLLEDYTDDKKLSAGAILKIMENAGSSHSDLVGDTILDARKKGYAWVLSDWLLDVENYPEYGAQILAKTWSRGSVSILSFAREFELFCNGNRCAKALSQWVLLDANTGRPMKIGSEMNDMYKVESKSNYEGVKLGRIALPETFESETRIQPRRVDIDFNEHVHNLTYLDYALEALPESVYKTSRFKRIRISYKSAVLYGEECICKYAFADGRHLVCIYGSDGTVKTIIELS